MIQQSTLFLTGISTIIFLLLASYSFRYRKEPGGTAFFLAMLLFSLLGVATIAELVVSGLQNKIMWRNFQQIPLFITPILIYIILYQFIGYQRNVIKRHATLLSVPIIIYLLLIFTDQWHHLMRAEIILKLQGDFENTVVESTNLSLMFIFYTRFIVIVALTVLFRNIKHVSVLTRKQYYILTVATLITLVATFVPETPSFKLNIAIASIPMGLLYFYAIFKYKLLQVHPVTNDKILENIKEGIVVVDKNGIIIQLNPSSVAILQQLSEAERLDFIGENLTDTIEDHQKLTDFYHHKQNEVVEVALADNYYNVAFISVAFTKKNNGALLIFTDITSQKKYEKNLLKKATIDSLTAVYNRQYFQEKTDSEITEAIKQGKRIAFVLFDIDRFKHINDTYGHQFGDLVLKKFANCLSNCVTHSGIVSRVGGEEFAILLSGRQEKDAYALAEEIRNNIEKMTVLFKDENVKVKITVSVGVATTIDSDMTFKKLFNQADQALYRSKNNGRNQTTMYKEL